ncbi:XdhC family protein [Jiella mangrovi]|uniref:XdhC family protein n=1 Tax=Jiella mangrovi TaxID=2821407 RepID=A0ABS4BGC0_9HYPH|nr:XdhC family protein [Jiella mangrovi]MBP0614990.1 XdhC family protein [Jiella mangrovi]
MDRALLSALNEERAARRAAVVVTELASGRQRLVREAEVTSDPLSAEIEKTIRSGKSGIAETPDGEVFLNAHLPPARIVAIGAVHISQALAPMAKIAGFDIEIVDPRTAFASADRFPGVTLHAEWPEDVLKQRPFDAYTAVCVITHDPKIDDFPLISALKTGCFYIGALGSRKTHAKRVERLIAAGIPQSSIDRIEAPIGADIGAANPGEIAVAILASVIEAFRKRKMFADRRGETEAA